MQILHAIGPLLPDSAACLGAFDGLHRGHQALLSRASRASRHTALVTFDNHPAHVLAPEHAPPLLQRPGQRARVCEQLGVSQLVLLPFDRTMASRGAVEFVRDVLAPLRLDALVVGADFRFGRGRDGTAGHLVQLGARYGIDVAVIEPVPGPGDAPAKISSSTIRADVAAGELEAAATALGRWYSVEGRVQRGAGRGRGLGFPTANVASRSALLPPDGVYVALLAALAADGSLASPVHAAVANLGPAPTFPQGTGDATRADLEVHALDVDLRQTLYGSDVEVWLGPRLRDPQRFASPAQLQQAIAHDIERARETIGSDPTRLALARLQPGADQRG
ncbi:MAG: riboflavin biosynthesis protein RibF [Myxococcales bacterium FL481]|nr:MAG: riboflavin biosynthesis protein RibF [Myxococcales bacterium FL481]